MKIIAEHPPQDGREWDNQCARCGSSIGWIDCEAGCDEDGFIDHDCGEDTCCCAYPEPNVVCDYCNGHGGWHVCMSSSDWCEANPLPGRASVKRGEIEWFVLEPSQ